MATCGSGIQSKLDPRNVWFGRNESYCVETVADVAGSLGGTFFTLEDVQGNTFYIWFDVDNGSVDPAPAGFTTGIEVDISTGASASAVAAAVVTAVSGNTSFYSESNKNELLIVTKELGEVANAIADGSAPTGFTFSTLLSGSLEDLGKTSAPIVFAPETTSLEIRADQTGEILQDELITGYSVTVSSSFQELTFARLLDIIGDGEGGKAGSPEGWGYGSGKVGTSRFSLAGSLLLLSDKGEEPLVVWKTVADMGSLNFSGVEQQVGELEFRAYIDESKVDAVNICFNGDYTQDVLWK